MKIKMILTREARKAGGDRYEAQIESEDRPLVIYWPQSISRPKGVALASLMVEVSYE